MCLEREDGSFDKQHTHSTEISGKKEKENTLLGLSHLKDPQMWDSPKSRKMVLANCSTRGVADGSGFLHKRKFNLKISLRLVSLS